MEIIDFRVRPQTEFFYRKIYPDPIPAFEPYFRLFKVAQGDPRVSLKPVEKCIEEMASFDISRAVIFGGDTPGNRKVFDLCQQYPDTYVGLAGVSIDDGISPSLEALELAYSEYNLRGLSLSPFATGVAPDDRRYYPLYALSEKMGRVVQCHSAIHYNREVPLDIAHPTRLDQIAVDFPKLNIVMSHAGFGFGDVGLTVALRHENVYMDFSGLHPRYLPERLVGMANTLLARKVIFGTNFPCMPYDIALEWKEFIREKNQPLFFAENAKKVLGID